MLSSLLSYFFSHMAPYYCFNLYFYSLPIMKIMVSGPITSWERDGETVETVAFFWGAPKSLQMVIAVMKLKDAYSFEGKL